MTHTLPTPEESLGFLTVAVSRLLHVRLNKEFRLAGLDVTPEQWGVLLHLWNTQGLTQEDLAASLCVEKSSLSRLLDGMERRRLVKRRRDPHDGRIKRIYTTPVSDALQERCVRTAFGLLGKFQASVGPEDMAACLRVLRQIRTTLKEGFL